MTSADVTVRICSDDDSGSYWFRCPACVGPVSRAASPRVVELLVSSGVRIEMWRAPAELDEPHYGPPLTFDDLLEFHELLATDDWRDDLSRSCHPSMESERRRRAADADWQGHG